MAETQKAAGSAAAQQASEVSLLDQIVEEGRFGKEPAALERGKDIIKQFVTQILQGEVTVSKDTEAMINARIAQIDHLVSIQLNEIMHHEEINGSAIPLPPTTPPRRRPRPSARSARRGST